MLAACASVPSEPLAPQPAPAQLASKPSIQTVTAVRITDRCRALAKTVKEPADYPGESPKTSREQWRAALRLANKKLGATDDCIERLVSLYHQGLKP